MFSQNVAQPVGDGAHDLAMSGDIGERNPGYKPLAADG
jgi:hypothetical protein